METILIPAGLIAQCRVESASTGRRVLDILQEQLAEPPQLFAYRLGKTLRYPVLGMDVAARLKLTHLGQ